MAMKIFNQVKGFFSGPEEKDEKTIMKERRVRETQIMDELKALLNEIEYSKDIKLPQELIEEYKIKQRMARMIKVLGTEQVSRVDTAGLDELIGHFVAGLSMALKENRHQMAYWSSMALYKSVESLRVEIPEYYAKEGSDEKQNMEKAMYAQKLEYAKRLDSIIELAKKQDGLEKEVADLEAELKRKLEDRNNREQAYQAMARTAEGKELIALVNAKRGTAATAVMSPKEKKIMAHEEKMADLEKTIPVVHSTYEVKCNDLAITITDIENMRVQLLQEPDVQDENLRAKIEVVNNLFIEGLEKRLADANEATIKQEELADRMKNLLQHEAIRRRYAAIREALEAMETRHLTDMQALLEARREGVRKAMNAQFVRQQEAEVQKELDQEIQRQAELERQWEEQKNEGADQDTDTDTDDETEVEYITDYDGI